MYLTCTSALSGNHIEEALSERTTRLRCLTALWSTLQPDRGQWPLSVQEHPGGRPHHQSRRRRESGLSHTLHPPLLRDIRRDTDEHWQHRVLSCPFTRGDVVCVGSELDHQIAHIHGAAIPLQPEAHLLRPKVIFRQYDRLRSSSTSHANESMIVTRCCSCYAEREGVVVFSVQEG